MRAYDYFLALPQDSVIAAVEKHPAVVTVQEHGMRALNYLSEHHKSDVSAASLSIQTIVHAMQRFPDNPIVQSNACRALWALGIESDSSLIFSYHGAHPFIVYVSS
jgi:hypothetical protein